MKIFVTSLMALTMLVGCVGTSRTDREMARAEAQSAFDRASGRPPTLRTLHAMATLLAAKGDDEQARIVLMHILNQYPEFIPAYNDLAALSHRQGQSVEARVVLMAGLVMDPNDPILHNNMGVCHLQDGEYEQALERFTHATELDPASKKYRGNRALALGLLGRDEEALRVYQSFLPSEFAHRNMKRIAQIREQEGGEIEVNEPESEGGSSAD